MKPQELEVFPNAEFSSPRPQKCDDSVITVLGLTTASLLGGAVLTEVTFFLAGLASQLYEAISNRDYPTVQGIMVFFAAIVVIASILIDIINAWIDPRIKY